MSSLLNSHYISQDDHEEIKCYGGVRDRYLRMKPHATRPAMVHPTPHHAARQLRIHCLFEGKYSRKTVVSKIRLPPAPKAAAAMRNPRDSQLGAAPAAIVNMEHRKREMLNAILRPMMSAKRPQKTAPISIPIYSAMVKPLWYDGWNSRTAWTEMIPCKDSCKASTAYLLSNEPLVS